MYNTPTRLLQYRESNHSPDDDNDNAALKNNDEMSPFSSNLSDDIQVSPSLLISELQINSPTNIQYKTQRIAKPSHQMSMGLTVSNNSSCYALKNYNTDYFSMNSSVTNDHWSKKQIIKFPSFKKNSPSNSENVFKLVDKTDPINSHTFNNNSSFSYHENICTNKPLQSKFHESLIYDEDNISMENFTVNKNLFKKDYDLSDYLTSNSLLLKTEIDLKSNCIKNNAPLSENAMNIIYVNKKQYNCSINIKLYLCVSILVGFIAAYYFQETQVDKPLTKFDLNSFITDLKTSLFGQHIAIDTINSSLSNFISNQSMRVLVLSFQGSSGTGKTFTASKLASYFQKYGDLYKYIVPYDFKDSSEVDSLNIFKWIMNNATVQNNEQLYKLYIIDEMDEAGEYLISSLQSAIECLSSFSVPLPIKERSGTFNRITNLIYYYLNFSTITSYFYSNEYISNINQHLDYDKDQLKLFKSKLLNTRECKLNNGTHNKIIIILVGQSQSNEINDLFFNLINSNISRTSINFNDFNAIINNNQFTSQCNPPPDNIHHDQSLKDKTTCKIKEPYSIIKYSKIFTSFVDLSFQSQNSITFKEDNANIKMSEKASKAWLSFLRYINTLVVFLPLEQAEIQLCIQAINFDKYNENIDIEKISNSFKYFVVNGKNYSPSGCKNVVRQFVFDKV